MWKHTPDHASKIPLQGQQTGMGDLSLYFHSDSRLEYEINTDFGLELHLPLISLYDKSCTQDQSACDTLTSIPNHHGQSLGHQSQTDKQTDKQYNGLDKSYETRIHFDRALMHLTQLADELHEQNRQQIHVVRKDISALRMCS